MQKNDQSLNYRSALLCLLSLLPLTGALGCAAAAIGAGGAAGTHAFTDRGAESEVKGSIQDVEKRAEEALSNAGASISERESEDGGSERKLVGKAGESTITVEMETSGENLTETEVIVREGTVKWNKDRAKSILDQIIQSG